MDKPANIRNMSVIAHGMSTTSSKREGNEKPFINPHQHPSITLN